MVEFLIFENREFNQTLVTMKTRVLLSTLILVLTVNLYSQEDPSKYKFYKTYIFLKDSSPKLYGTLYSVNESSVYLSNSLSKGDYWFGNYNTSQILITDIDKIKIRRLGSIGKGVLFGVLAGFTAGYIMGRTMYDENSGGLLGMLLTIPGAAIGGFIGSITIQIPINGDIPTYQKNMEKLKKYSINK